MLERSLINNESDDFNKSNSKNIKIKETSIYRYIVAVISGTLIGNMFLAAASAGIKFNYNDEMPLETWGFLFWGEHFIIRALWSFIATSIGAFFAGLIARDRGALIGIATTVPSMLFWLLSIYIWLFSTGNIALETYGYVTPSLGNKIMSVLILLMSIPISLKTGLYGQEISKHTASHFDKNTNSALGIKWYHYLWMPIPLYGIILQSAWAIDYCIDWWKLTFLGDLFGLMLVVPGLFLIGIFASLYITWNGLSKAYDYLSNLSRLYSKRETFIGVLKYGIGFPILAALIQGFISIIPLGIKWLFD